MKKNIFNKVFFTFLIFSITFFYSCNNEIVRNNSFHNNSLINTSHLNFLYENILMEKDTVGIIHIYSNYPDYEWVGDDDEGIACVDDAARAALFYMKYYNLNSKKKIERESLNKARNLIKFLMKMQAENGFFYNFIWPDYSINKNFKTSVAEPNWWSWRAILTLSEAYPFFEKIDKNFSIKIKNSLDQAVKVTMNWLNNNYDGRKIVYYGGFELPSWLPNETAADQAAIILEGLTNYYRVENDSLVLHQINKIVDGIIKMQKGDSLNIPYYAFLSWQNTWHAWGNNQAVSLIEAGITLDSSRYIQSAIKEVKYFYPFLLKKNFLSSFEAQKNEEATNFTELKKFSQIAYGITPMVSASLKAYKITKDTAFLNIGIESATWFFGNNAAGQLMYNPKNGICFDGINSETDLSGRINKNSGAESTIEALLALTAIEKIPEARKIMYDYYIQND